MASKRHSISLSDPRHHAESDRDDLRLLKPLEERRRLQ
jgi:hypothetical protein